MKLILKLLLAVALCGAVSVPIVTGCKTASAQTTTYRTLASIGSATDTAVKAYFDGVVHGTIKTNGVPGVARAYSNFQLAYSAAIIMAKSDTNAVASAGLASSSAAVTAAIAAGK